VADDAVFFVSLKRVHSLIYLEKKKFKMELSLEEAIQKYNIPLNTPAMDE